MIQSNPLQYSAKGIMILSFLILLACNPIPSSSHENMESTSKREAAFHQYPDVLYPIKTKEKWGYMNRNGEIILKPSWADAGDFKQEVAVAAIIENEKTKYGFIDKKGNWIIEPQYDKLGNFSEGLALIEKNGLCGFVDITGKEVIPCRFEAAGFFSEGYAAIQLNGLVGFINSSGEVVIKPQFTCSVQHPVFHEGLAPVFGIDEQTGFIDTTGLWAIEPKFHSASSFKEGKA